MSPPAVPIVCPSCSASAPPGAAICSKCGAPLADQPDGAEAAGLLGELGRALAGRYVIGEVLGSGRGGITVRALHTASKKNVAVKVSWNDPVARTQVLRETVLTAKVGHPNALAVRDIPAPEPMLVVEMPLTTGGTLSDLLEAGKPVPYPQVLEIVRAVGGALDQAHAAGIIHGGLRPIKILLDDTGKPHVSDFEIRIPRRADWDVSQPSEVGAQAYMPLEQRHDSLEIDGRVDQYALAIIAYELLRGRPTWHVGDEGVLEIDAIEIMVHRPISPDAPLSASMAIKRATAKDPAFRYSSAGAFVRAFSGEAADIVPMAHIHRSEIAIKERPSRLWFAVPVVLIAAIVMTRPNARVAAIEAWQNSKAFALGQSGSRGKPSIGSPLDPTTAPAPPSRAESQRAQESGAPTNTRVGDTTVTSRPGSGSNGPVIDPYVRNAGGASNTAAGATKDGKQGSKRDPSPEPAAPASPAPATREQQRRSAVGGEITGGSKSAANDNPPPVPLGDGALVVSLNANARAVVIVDGRPRGQTPLTLKLSAGTHVVALRGRDSYSPAVSTIVIAANDTTRATFTLSRP
jgi:serine/threonine-protein kinase